MGFVQVDKLSEKHLRELVVLFQKEWWTAGRTLVDTRRMLDHSIAIGWVDSVTDQLAGFARIVSDRVYKALVLDVIVATSYRGRGLGKVLMDAVMDHPELRDVRNFELYCKPDVVAFYERWGFSNDFGDMQFLRSEPPR